MNTDTLHLAPKAIRLAVARAIVEAAKTANCAGEEGKREPTGEEQRQRQGEIDHAAGHAAAQSASVSRADV